MSISSVWWKGIINLFFVLPVLERVQRKFLEFFFDDQYPLRNINYVLHFFLKGHRMESLTAQWNKHCYEFNWKLEANVSDCIDLVSMLDFYALR